MVAGSEFEAYAIEARAAAAHLRETARMLYGPGAGFTTPVRDDFEAVDAALRQRGLRMDDLSAALYRRALAMAADDVELRAEKWQAQHDHHRGDTTPAGTVL